MRKTFVIDTNVLLSDPNAINSFEENDVIIPLVVFEELDKHKSRFDEVGRNARYVSRLLDELRHAGDLFTGICLESGGLLRVASIKTKYETPLELRTTSVDNMIIHYMMELRDSGVNARLISKDVNIRLKCDALGIKSEDYVKIFVNKNIDDLYTGVETVFITPEELDVLYDSGTAELACDKLLFPNQILILNNGTKTSGIARNIGKNGTKYQIKKIPDYRDVYGLKPRNKEQNFSLDLLLDPSIKLLTITGRAGCGKSLLTIASALFQLKATGAGGSDGKYEKIVIARPIQPLGKDLGYLPGTIEEKLDPWITPIKDNINFLAKSTRKRASNSPPFLKFLQDHGLIEIEALTYIRGRSIANAFMIIDEAQNLSIHELKTIVTRVGEGTKIVLNGDIEQIDNVNVDMHTNALSYAIEKFKDHPIAGHVTLVKGERSELASIASEIL